MPRKRTNTNKPQSTEQFAQSTVTRLLNEAADRKRQEEITKEELEELKKCVNRIFASRDGQFFGKCLVRFCGVFKVDTETNSVKLVEDNGKKKVYLQFIRPLLDKTLRMEIE
jgi:hypothetical protein